MLDRLDPAQPAPSRARAEAPGPGDDTFYDLVEARLRRLVRDNPVLGTALGLHALDDELGDGGREAVLAELEADRRHLTQVEAIDPADLSATARFERDLELHNVRRAIFDADVLRIWERRSLALDTIGDGLFLLFARDHAPLAERLAAIAGRLEAIPRLPRAGALPRGRAAGPDVAAGRDRDRRRAPHLLRRDRRGRGRDRRRAGATPARAGRRSGQGRGRAVRDLARGHARGRHRRLADRTRAARRARGASGLRRPRRGRRSSSSAGRSWPRRRRPASRPRARSTRTRRRPRSSIGSSPTSRPTSRPP